MDSRSLKVTPYAHAAVRLLRASVSEDQANLWQQVTGYQTELSIFFEKIGIALVIDKRDGYAYLKQIELDDAGATIGLVRRMPLSYELSLVCVLLREWLQEFELNDLETVNLYISPKQFRERIELFFKEKTNELKFIKDLNRHFISCEEMGFLKGINKTAAQADDYLYEVKKIIKARVTIQELAYFKQLLEDEL